MNNETPRKNYKFGIELELMTLDEKGKVKNYANDLINIISKENLRTTLKKECGQNMVELESLPKIFIPDLIEQVISDLDKINSIANEQQIYLYPFATYPGKFTPKIQDSKRYQIQQQIFGKQKFDIAARVVGLHCHFTLPWGVFDSNEKTVKNLIDSKHKESLINIHNLFVAMDPALTTFAQSSPFYQGQYLGKDSRIIAYRGGKVFNYPEGLYANFEEFGSLQPYINTNTDLLHIMTKRFTEWKVILKKLGINIHSLLKQGSILDTAWNPVKINSHGTIEHRGMDTNLPSIITALALCIKYVSLLVQEHFVKIIPADSAIKNPFRYDTETETITVPPHTYVRNVLQAKAAKYGLEDEEIFRYCSGFLKLAKDAILKDRVSLIAPLEAMLSEKQTKSDEILNRAKKMKVNPKEGINETQSAELAMSYSDDLKTDIEQTKHSLAKFRLNTTKLGILALFFHTLYETHLHLTQFMTFSLAQLYAF